MQSSFYLKNILSFFDRFTYASKHNSDSHADLMVKGQNMLSIKLCIHLLLKGTYHTLLDLEYPLRFTLKSGDLVVGFVV